MVPMDALLRAAWHEHDRFKNSGFVAPSSIPILYFGNRAGYMASACRVVTAGLNPSKTEFPSHAPLSRFPAAAPAVDGRERDSARRAALLAAALDSYFVEDPYRSWFNPAYGAFLHGLGASFYEGPAMALHTDLCSPLATDPTWSGLPDRSKTALAQNGVPLWHQLMAVLEPDIIVVSVARKLVDQITFPAISPWASTAHYTHTGAGGARRKPYRVETRWVQVVANKPTLLVFGPAAQLPFGLLTDAQKDDAGQRVLDAFRLTRPR